MTTVIRTVAITFLKELDGLRQTCSTLTATGQIDAGGH